MGNICRSPAAEMIFQKVIDDAGRSREFLIDSAGTLGHHQGSSPDHRMIATLEKRGYGIFGKARKILAKDLESFDLVLTMDEDNLAEVRLLDPEQKYQAKIRPFVEFCREHRDTSVPDPYYGGQSGFDHVVELLEDGCNGLLNHFPSLDLES